MHTRTRPARTKYHNSLIAAVSLAAVGLLAACGSSSTGGTSGPSASPSVAANGSGTFSAGIPCAQITSLRTSLDKLSHITVSPGSVGQASGDLATVQRELTALKGQAGGAFSAQASQLSNALSQLSKDAQTLAAHPSVSNLTNMTRAVQKLKATAQPLVKEMQTACP